MRAALLSPFVFSFFLLPRPVPQTVALDASCPCCVTLSLFFFLTRPSPVESSRVKTREKTVEGKSGDGGGGLVVCVIQPIESAMSVVHSLSSSSLFLYASPHSCHCDPIWSVNTARRTGRRGSKARSTVSRARPCRPILSGFSPPTYDTVATPSSLLFPCSSFSCTIKQKTNKLKKKEKERSELEQNDRIRIGERNARKGKRRKMSTQICIKAAGIFSNGGPKRSSRSSRE